MNYLRTIALAGGASTLIMGTLLYKFRQYELMNASWYKEACMKAANHEGVRVLIGPPPLKMSDVERYAATDFIPLKNVDPEPLYVLKIPLEGKNGKGNVLLWMNYLTPIEEARKDINAWNVGLIEVQIGETESNKFIVD